MVSRVKTRGEAPVRYLVIDNPTKLQPKDWYVLFCILCVMHALCACVYVGLCLFLCVFCEKLEASHSRLRACLPLLLLLRSQRISSQKSKKTRHLPFYALRHRVVAVFTSGQAWQFKGWKYTNPTDLFANARGFYVKYDDEKVPDSVKSWDVKVIIQHTHHI